MRVIPLSEFSGVHGSRHARLYIKASDSGSRTVVSEKPGSRLLTRIGKLPLLRNRESVRERRNAAAREDQYTRSVFQEALKQVYGDAFSQQAIQDITGKPLTRRVVKKIINSAEKMKVCGGKPSSSDKAGGAAEIAYDLSLKELGLFARKAKMITGSELKNMETLATGNGCLRSLMTAAQGVAQFSGNADIAEAVRTLLDRQIGGIPFSQFGTCSTTAGAVQWIKNASQDDLEGAAGVIRQIAGDFEQLFQNIKSGQNKINSPSPETTRPDNAGVGAQTQVMAETARHWGAVVQEFSATRR
ncbi:type III secretion system effector BopA family protein [Salmonella enterica]|uniref:type III secretion system effector BopA family protein n=1 Tax=Salmonella enterica TaxID=28901 RepID=UPI000B9FAE5D|nr:type III secretion system effector BopA family protein [Salmonella enterica]EBX0575663.1 hypothetical protein [Salmonella enterica subsp. enterica serovar Utah]ECR1919447.1 hypothetical protein [Salmonella enterica subsp. enterica serovar Johannesburg]EEA6506665.1 hypothetical protein [Salmonella enterica subsp. enterica serovar Reading]EIC3513047.1 hypothetical protein [Salmonella enterica subsp. enterica serovar Oranienburg]ECR9670473.1 hypothetical protein [Salmonella enterica]